jgi:hypothetical protein
VDSHYLTGGGRKSSETFTRTKVSDDLPNVIIVWKDPKLGHLVKPVFDVWRNTKVILTSTIVFVYPSPAVQFGISFQDFISNVLYPDRSGNTSVGQNSRFNILDTSDTTLRTIISSPLVKVEACTVRDSRGNQFGDGAVLFRWNEGAFPLQFSTSALQRGEYMISGSLVQPAYGIRYNHVDSDSQSKWK